MAADSSEKRKLMPEHVPALREYFRTVPERTRMTSLEAVREMKEDIRLLQEKGYSLSDIGDMIERQGFDLPLSTLRNYLKQIGYRKGASKKNRKAQSTDSASTAASRRNRQLTQEKASGSTASGKAGSFDVAPDKKV